MSSGAGPGGAAGAGGDGAGDGQAPASPVDTDGGTTISLDALRSMPFGEQRAFEAANPGVIRGVLEGAMAGEQEAAPVTDVPPPDELPNPLREHIDPAVTRAFDETAQAYLDGGDYSAFQEANEAYVAAVAAAYARYAETSLSDDSGRPVADGDALLSTGELAENPYDLAFVHEGTEYTFDQAEQLLETVSKLSFQERSLFEAQEPGILNQLMIAKMSRNDPARHKAIREHEKDQQRDAEWNDWRAGLRKGRLQ